MAALAAYIGAIVRRIDGRDDNDDPNLSNKSKTTQVLHLFEKGNSSGPRGLDSHR